MSKFNFATKEERDGAIKRAQTLKPRVNGVYATAQGYVVDGFKGKPEILVSFHNLDALLAGEDISVAEVIEIVQPEPESAPAIEEAPADLFKEAEENAEPVAEAPKEEVAEQEPEVVAAPPVVETKKERKARIAKEKAEA
jgi:hypothetical protein